MRLAQGLVALDGHHVGARHHDLAHDGVAELEDRVDHLALAGLDERGLAREVDQVAQLGLGGERAVAVARARGDRVAERHEQAGQRPEHAGAARPARAPRAGRPGRRAGGRRCAGDTPTSTNDSTVMTPMADQQRRPAAVDQADAGDRDQHGRGRPRRRPAGTSTTDRYAALSRRRCAARAVAPRRPSSTSSADAVRGTPRHERGLGRGEQEGDQQAARARRGRAGGHVERRPSTGGQPAGRLRPARNVSSSLRWSSNISLSSSGSAWS